MQLYMYLYNESHSECCVGEAFIRRIKKARYDDRRRIRISRDREKKQQTKGRRESEQSKSSGNKTDKKKESLSEDPESSSRRRPRGISREQEREEEEVKRRKTKMQDVGLEAREAAIREVAKLLPSPSSLSSIASIRSDYLQRLQVKNSSFRTYMYTPLSLSLLYCLVLVNLKCGPFHNHLFLTQTYMHFLFPFLWNCGSCHYHLLHIYIDSSSFSLELCFFSSHSFPYIHIFLFP